jgi:hypothetical protein
MADYPATWNWDKDGPVVSGEVLDIRYMPEAKYGPVNVMELDGPQGHVSVWLSPAALKRWLDLEAPQQGDFVQIQFDGWEPILDKNGIPKQHPERKDEIWQMRTFSASVKRGDASTSSVSVPDLDAQIKEQFSAQKIDDSDIPF